MSYSALQNAGIIDNSQSTDLNLTYNLLIKNLAVQIKKTIECQNPTCVKANDLQNYVTDFELKFYNRLSSRSYLVKQLYLLHQTCQALEKFNNEELNLSYQEYRAKVLYPNIVYILIRLLPKARIFLQSIIRYVYRETSRKSNSIIQNFTNSFYINQDVIKTDILYEFLGNGMKKLNPLNVNNINLFYKQVFRNVLFYYFKKEQRLHTELVSYTSDNPMGELIYVPTGLTIYRDVLYSLQVEKMYKTSPTLDQIKYNYSIFRNVVLNNEIQSVYFASQKDTFLLKDNQYKLVHVYQDDIEKKLIKIKKLPTIYRLLKSVHIISKNKPYKSTVIKPKVIETAILEELIHPFRNMFSHENIYEILREVSKNFTNSILSGEYINLMTLSPILIDQITFINQVKKFIRICLEPNGN